MSREAYCYRECLKLAVDNELKSIAFPAISCGAYHFPIDKACEIAMSEALDFSNKTDSKFKLILVCYESKIKTELEKIWKVKNE